MENKNYIGSLVSLDIPESGHNEEIKAVYTVMNQKDDKLLMLRVGDNKELRLPIKWLEKNKHFKVIS